MRRYIAYISIFFVGLIGLYVAYYVYQSYKTQLPAADIYMWGDSRMYWGINVEQLEQLTGKTICPTQHEGASVYDMMTFVNKIPSHSTCVLGLSECVLFRDHESDYNRSGFNVWATSQLVLAGYSLKDVYGISRLNRWTPIDIVTPSHSYYEVADTITTPEPMPGWVVMYNKSYPYYSAKAKCYDKAIQTLLDKHCDVILLDFAGYRDVEEMAEGTPNRILSSSLIENIIDNYRLDTSSIVVESDSLLYYDLSHLNMRGADLVTKKMVQNLKKNIYIRIIEL